MRSALLKMNYKVLFRISNHIATVLVLLGLFSLPIFSYAVTLSTCTDSAGNSVECLVPCGGAGQATCTLSELVTLANNIINFILFYLAAPLGTLSIAIGGILMITAGGDQGQ